MHNSLLLLLSLAKHPAYFTNHSLFSRIQNILEESRGNGQVSDVTGSAGVTGRYLAKAIISDKVVTLL